MHQAGPPQRRDLVGGQAEPLPRRGGEVGDRTSVPEGVRRLEVDEVRDREECLVELVVGQHHGQRRLGADHGIPRVDHVELGQEQVGVGGENVREVRVELLAPLGADELPRGRDAAHPVRDLDELADDGQASRDRHAVTPELARPAAAVPLLVRRVQGVEGLLRQPEVLAEPARHLRVVGDHGVQVAMARHRELEADAEPVPISPSPAGPEPADHGEGALGAPCSP